MDDKEKLKEQIIHLRDEVREAARLQWGTYCRLNKKAQTFKILDIILTAVSSVGIISFFFHGNLQINIVTSFITLSSLSLNLYTSNFRDDENKTVYADAAGELWAAEKGFDSLLTDFDSLDVDAIRTKRDELIEEVDKINREYFCLNQVTHSKKKKKEARQMPRPSNSNC